MALLWTTVQKIADNTTRMRSSKQNSTLQNYNR